MIEISSKDLQRLAADLERASTNFARDKQRALSSTQRASRTQVTRSATAVYNVSTRRILQDVTVRNITDGFVITGSNKPITLASYGAKQIGKPGRSLGVRVTVERANGVRTITSGFVATGQAGNKLPWTRTGRPKVKAKAGRYAGTNALREPIRPLTGPSVADMLNNEQVFEPIETFVFDKLATEISRQLARYIEGG